MKTIEQLQAEQARELETLKKQHALASDLLLPCPPDSVQLTGRGVGNDWVSYKVDGLRGALELFRRFNNVVPMYAARTSCTRIRPAENMTEQELSNCKGPFALDITARTNAERRTADVEVKFFTRVSDGRAVRVTLKVKGPDYIGAYGKLRATATEEHDRRTGRVISRGFKANTELHAGCDHFISWSSGEIGAIKTYCEHSHFFSADHDADGTAEENSHALGILQNLCDSLEPVEVEAAQ